MKYKKISFSFGKKNISFILREKVFAPNLTTQMLISGIYDYSIAKKIFFKRVLDLGCGCGAIGICLSKLGIAKYLYMSDISTKAVSNSKYNLQKCKVDGETKRGNSFSPWKSYKFDLIVNDISAISSELVKISPWFKEIPCHSGKDGTKLTINFLKKVKEYSLKNCKIFFPILSLSNEKKILNFAKKKFKNVKLLKSMSWPLPKKMHRYNKKLNFLKKRNFINFTEISGQIICQTSIYMIKI